jgi:hypothetical protein
MGLRRHTASQVRVPERSAVLTMAASRGGTPSVGVQASAAEEDFMAVADSMVAADPTEAVVEGRLGHITISAVSRQLLIKENKIMQHRTIEKFDTFQSGARPHNNRCRRGDSVGNELSSFVSCAKINSGDFSLC